jgi:predicted RNase H-like HicB family nuclease
MLQYYYGRSCMERIINLHIEKLPEGVYLATSDDVQGLVAQGRTVSEAIEIARDVARRLFEAKKEREGGPVSLPAVSDKFDYALVIGT